MRAKWFEPQEPEGKAATSELDEDDFADLFSAARSSTDFWDNPVDDQEWNDA